MTVIILFCKLSFVWCIGPICSLVHNVSSDCTRYVCRFERGQRSRLRGKLRQQRLCAKAEKDPTALQVRRWLNLVQRCMTTAVQVPLPLGSKAG